MARRASVSRLNIFLNSRSIGQVTRSARGVVEFKYDDAWLHWPEAIPLSLSAPLREEPYGAETVGAVLDGLLPDEEIIRREIAERVGTDGRDPVSLLSAIGRDCVGALQFLPDGEEPGPAGAVEGVPLDDAQIATLLRSLARAPLGLGEDEAFRISLAGAQEKTALLHTDEGWRLPSGATATTHIFKPAIGQRGDVDLSLSVENEHLCLRLLEAFGLACAATEIRDFEDQHVLVVERFDRLWTRDGRLLRVPQEDLCQALGYPVSRKYEQQGGPGAPELLRLLATSDHPLEDRQSLLKALLIFWLMGATDGHAKNFSVRLFSGGRFDSTPFYDVLSTQPNVDAGQLRHGQFKLALAAGDNRHYRVDSVRARHFLETAVRGGLSRAVALAAIDEVYDRADQAIADGLAKLPGDFPEALIGSITTGMRTRLAQDRQLQH